MSLITDEMRAKASEMYKGDEICQEKSKFLLTEMNLPNGLLPLEDMIECGYIKDTGFVWLISKKKTQYRFKKIDKLVQYGTEVTAYVEPNRIKKLTGVKAKELLLWVTLNEIKNVPETGSVVFKTPTGLSRTFPSDAFVIEGTKDLLGEKSEDAKDEDDKDDEVVVVEDKVEDEGVEKKDLVEVAAKSEAAVEVKEV